ncbi:MAG: DUF2786 domain-containing protein [Deltaproteobacteria bacterium]|nr:DUF2786 domain-containing protein [Deltaproteobacteria bacterium]
MTSEGVQANLDAMLKNIWRYRLRHAHEDFLENVSGARFLPKVTIEISDSESNWGSWRNDIRRISVSQKLFRDHNWDVVLGVLGHETAHQLTDDLCPAAKSETPHGPAFQRMCRNLHLDPIYHHASVDLTENGFPPSAYGPRGDLEENPLLEKIKKLLALSNSPEQHEAEAALAKASELMSRYNIDSDALQDEEKKAGYERWRLPLNSARITKRYDLIAFIIQNHFFSKVVFTNEYQPLSDSQACFMDIIGKPANLSMASHVFHFLVERTDSLWERFKPHAAIRGEKGVGAKNAFMTNLLRSFNKKLSNEEEKRKKEAFANTGVRLNSAGVILLKDPELSDYVDYHYPRLSTRRSSSSGTHSPYSSEAGRKAGEALNLRTPVGFEANQNGARGYLN